MALSRGTRKSHARVMGTMLRGAAIYLPHTSTVLRCLAAQSPSAAITVTIQSCHTS